MKNLGALGVRVFFVISGMLITRLLLQQWRQNGRISLKRFYIRRTLRIFPAMWFYVAVMTALSIFGIISLQRYDILCALTYTMNYPTNRSWYLGHIWSLSVEEQFYLLWPVAVFLCKPRLASRIALLALVLAPLFRLTLILWFPTVTSEEWFPSACDSLATGCSLTLLAPKLRQRWIAPCIASRWFFVAPVLVLLTNALRFHVQGRSLTDENARMLFLLLDTVGVILMNFGIALIIERVVEYPGDIWGQILNWKPVVWLGTISYSLYLWQMPFFNHWPPTGANRLPQSVVFALAAACISYYCVEKPILQLGNRLVKRNGQRILPAAQ